ncbi:NXPE family member 3-like, partial [Neolamprologus brichardi]|uniref:NXPE family member 3-like n=1 Tax=Neolamprologus brichardi TaxID=32507 RepID=UPI001643CD3E
MGNVRSLSSKIDELSALVRRQREYRECSLMCFMDESWMHQDIPDENASVEGFHTVWADRDSIASAACDTTHSAIARLQTEHPSAFIVISGDFNHVSLDNTPTFRQYVDCPTRGEKILDLLYANVKMHTAPPPYPHLLGEAAAEKPRDESEVPVLGESTPPKPEAEQSGLTSTRGQCVVWSGVLDACPAAYEPRLNDTPAAPLLATVMVILVHPSEAVTELRRMNIEEPDRIFFKSRFRSSLFARTTTCNVCLRPTEQPVCNYTDLHTGEPWFCYKPTNLSCNARISNYNGGYKKNLTTMEKLFQRGVNMKVSIPASGPASVTILPKQKGQSEVSSSSGESEPSGYYYQGVWRALDGSTVHQFNTSSAITQCLKGKVVHMYGDSTMRQWFEYLNASLPDLKEFNLHSPKSIGPLMALDYANNIFVTHRAHGPPLRTVSVPSMELHYIANELDNVVGGSNTVVVFGIWAHFDNFPIEFYIRRLMSIRRAVVRLLSRAPGTVVVIRTGNPKSFTPSGAFVNSDWYTFQRLKALRAVFKGFNVHLVDAWEMVLAHHLPHNMHPQPPIIKNMINVLLSY